MIIMKKKKNPANLSPESPREFSPFASGRYSSLEEGLNVVAYLPEELIADILSYLPVKLLLRYKCVSKTWCSLIESQHFVKMHLRKSIECKTSFGIIARACSYYLADSDLLNDAAAVEIEDPLKTSFSGSAIMGSSNGLFCMLTAKRDILLWNPSTRKCQKLPDAPIDLTRFCCIHGGFGFDLLNDDYRVVVIAQPKTNGSENLDSKVLVYSLKTNSWKPMKDLSCFLQFQELWGTFVSNNLHWVTMDTHDSIRYLGIFAFDFEDEKYYLLSLPDLEVQTFNMTVGILGGSLTILANQPNDHMNVWVMNKYGKRNSWSKLFSVKQLQVIGGFDTLRPLIYSKSGKDVLLEVNKKKVMWFDLERNEVKNVSIGGIPGIFRLEVYHQSLVPLNNDFESDEKQQKQRHENQKKKNQNKRQKKNDMRGFHSMGFKLLL